MKNKLLKSVLAALSFLVLLTVSSQAQIEVPIVNDGFETGTLSGWSTVASGGYGSGVSVINNVSNQMSEYPNFPNPLPGTASGTYYASICGYDGNGPEIAYQDVTANGLGNQPLQPNTTYTFTVAIGVGRYSYPNDCTISLVNGTTPSGTVLATAHASTLGFGNFAGTFKDLTVTYTTGSSVSGDLTVEISTTYGYPGHNPMYFDNVQLTKSSSSFQGLGVYVSFPDNTNPTNETTYENAMKGYETVMGQRANFVDEFSPDYNQAFSSWPGNAGWGAGSLALACSSTHLNHTYTPIVSMGLVDVPDKSNEVATLNSVAAGAQDSVIQQCILAYKNAGFTKIYLRLGWEQNGNWEPWQVDNNDTNCTAYVAAWKHVANLAHNLNTSYPITGITVKTVWCPCMTNIYDIDSTGTDVTSLSYPTDAGYTPGGTGDQYVDIIGPDIYQYAIYVPTDASNGHPTEFYDWSTKTDIASASAWILINQNREHYWDYPLAQNQYNATSGWGMPKFTAMAELHKKPLGISECGTRGGTTANDTHGVADDGDFPAYLANRLSTAVAGGVHIEYVTIWDFNSGGTGNWHFSDGLHPQEQAAWQAFVTTMAGLGQ